jgi:chromosome segregation ATPase
MRMLVFICGALLALAIAFVLLSSGPYPDALLELFRSQPRPQQIAGIVIAVIALIVLAAAIWSNEQLRRQRDAAEILESRLRLEETQRDVDMATHQLGRTVSDSAMRELHERLSRAENDLNTHLQQRSEVSEFQARVEEIQARQNALKDKLGEAVTKRKSIEQLFVEYQATQQDIERTLSNIERDQQGDTLDARIGSLSQFTKLTESRFRDLEQSSKLLTDLGQEFEALQGRLAPLQADRSGIKAVIHQLIDLEAQLGASIGTLERDGDISLTERIKRITESRQALSQRVSTLAEELSKLDSSHKDINSLFARLSHELKTRCASGLETDEEHKSPPISAA